MIILPFAIILALLLIGAIVWALVRAFGERRAGRRVPLRLAAAAAVSGAVLWAGLTFAFAVWEGIGHSRHPYNESPLPGLIVLFVLVVAPAGVILLLAHRPPRKSE